LGVAYWSLVVPSVVELKELGPALLIAPNVTVADLGQGFQNHSSQNHSAISAAE